MELNPIFSDDRDECLAHYGVLGMKWGVRNAETLRKYEGGNGRSRSRNGFYRNADGSLTNRGKKRQARRDKMVEYEQATIKRGKRDQADAKKAVSDINKNGAKSKYVKDLYNNDPDFQEGLVDIQDKGRDLWDDGLGKQRPLSSLSKETQKTIADRAKKHYSFDLNFDSSRHEKIIDNVKNTPINKRSYAEALHRENAIRGGAAIAGAVLPVAGSLATSKLTGRSAKETIGKAAVTAVFVSPWTAVGGFASAPNISDKYYKKHVQ